METSIQIIQRHLRAAEAELNKFYPAPHEFPSQNGAAAKIVHDALDLASRIQKTNTK